MDSGYSQYVMCAVVAFPLSTCMQILRASPKSPKLCGLTPGLYLEHRLLP